MTAESVASSDKGVGYSVLFGLFALAGVLAMAVDPGGTLGATGFALAVVSGCLVVAATHLY